MTLTSSKCDHGAKEPADSFTERSTIILSCILVILRTNGVYSAFFKIGLRNAMGKSSRTKKRHSLDHRQMAAGGTPQTDQWTSVSIKREGVAKIC